jgi:hypothetical protein
MARLPSERYLIQQAGGIVRLLEDFTECLIVAFDPADGNACDHTVFVMGGTAIITSFDPSDQNAVAIAQKSVYDSALTQDDKNRAHFWSGFFYGQDAQG